MNVRTKLVDGVEGVPQPTSVMPGATVFSVVNDDGRVIYTVTVSPDAPASVLLVIASTLKVDAHNQVVSNGR